MVAQHQSTRQRLVQAALQLFAAQGVTETTTRQIAEVANVNEVTLFRHFGSKHRLLLAVLEEAEVFTQIGKNLERQAHQIHGWEQALQAYIYAYLQALEQIPEFVRSLVGEAGQYPPENRQAIGRGLTQIHHYTVEYLTSIMSQEHIHLRLSTDKLASLLNTLLLGYAVIEFTTEFHQLWPEREAFIAELVELFLSTEFDEETLIMPRSSLPKAERGMTRFNKEVQDLPAPLVRAILQKARKCSPQDYALAYVMFAAGLSSQEIINLQRANSISDRQQHILQVTKGVKRQVPLNQWIMGYRYGSYMKNPLTQWLKARRDEQQAIFITPFGQPMSEVDLGAHWQEFTAGIITPSGSPPAITQAQETWCVEMLMRGMNVETLSILTGYNPEQLQPYVSRAREKAALEQAIRLDQNPDIKIDSLN